MALLKAAACRRKVLSSTPCVDVQQRKKIVLRPVFRRCHESSELTDAAGNAVAKPEDVSIDGAGLGALSQFLHFLTGEIADLCTFSQGIFKWGQRIPL